MTSKYDYLIDQYPEEISLDQFYRICRIAKRSALYLVQNGIVPAKDNGQKTWRYRIALSDVIAYLNRRDQSGSMIPIGTTTSRYKKRPSNPRMSFSSMVPLGDTSELTKYFKHIYADYPDVLYRSDVMEMTGLSKKTTLLYFKTGVIKSFGVINGKHIISKEHLLEFVTSPRYIDLKINTETFIKILRGFELWKAAK